MMMFSLTFKELISYGPGASNLHKIILRIRIRIQICKCNPEKNTLSYIFKYVPDVGRMSCNRSSAPPPSAVPAVFGQSTGDLDLFDEENEIKSLYILIFSRFFSFNSENTCFIILQISVYNNVSWCPLSESVPSKGGNFVISKEKIISWRLCFCTKSVAVKLGQAEAPKVFTE
jgi:hypothetical protein